MRTSKEMNQKALSEAIGFEQSYISRIEKDERPPSEAVCVALARVFEMSADDVLEQAGIKEATPVRLRTARHNELLRLADEMSEDDLARLLVTARAWATENQQRETREKSGAAVRSKGKPARA